MADLVRAASDFLAALLSSIGFVGRPRRRAGIREDIELLGTLEAAPAFGPSSRAHRMMTEHITTEVAKLAGVELRRRRQVPWSSVFVAAAIGLPCAYWAYKLDQHDFAWLSVLPGAVALLMLLGILGMVTGSDDAAEEAEPEATAAVEGGG
jgi:hypothetical protein